MKYLTTLSTEIEVLFTPAAVEGDSLDTPVLWVEPDWDAMIKKYKEIDGVRRVTITVDPEDALDPYSAGRTYTLELLVHARQYAGEEVWQTYRQAAKEAQEPISSIDMLEGLLNDEGGLGGPLGDFADAILGQTYVVSAETFFEIGEAA